MAKSDKATVVRRIQEILRLLLAGGEFEDIRQYAASHDWKLSDRQLRRYQEWAYRKVVDATKRSQKELLGRHLMQRRALYARALKTSDIRTALEVLRDEAELEGLYPNAKDGPTPLDERFPAGSPLSREERFRRILAAEAQGDKKEIRLIEHLTPRYSYRMSDTMMPRQMLHIMALTHAAEQLDHAGMVMMALWRITTGQDKNQGWGFIGNSHAYRFKLGVDAWEIFTNSLGVDGQKLLKDNHQGSMLELFADQIYGLAPTAEEFAQHLAEEGEAVETLLTAESIAQDWHHLLKQVLRD